MQKEVTILLVEDDEVDALAIERAFRHLRIANPLAHAKDGLEALEHLRGTNGREPISRPFIVLLDLNMPRMNGIEFLEEVRADKALRDTVVFVLTTSKADEDKVKAYRLNVAGYIVKESVGDDFLDCLHMLAHYWRVIEFPK